MSSNSFVASIDLNLRPSFQAHRYLFLLHAVPLSVLPFAMQPGWLMLAVLVGVLASWLWLRRHAAFGFGARALVRLICHEQGWSVVDASGVRSDAELLGHSFVHARLMVLNFRLASGERRTRVLLGDELGADPLRRLRARLAVAAAVA